MSVTKQLMGPINFHSRKKKYYGSQQGPSTVNSPTFFKINKKLIHTGLKQLEGE